MQRIVLSRLSFQIFAQFKSVNVCYTQEIYSVKTLIEGQSTVLFFLKFEPFVEIFWLSALHMRIYQLV